MPIPADPLSLAIMQLMHMGKAGAVDADELRRLANTISELHHARRDYIEVALIHLDLEAQQANRSIKRLRLENDDLQAKLERAKHHALCLEQRMLTLEKKGRARERKVTEKMA